MNRTLTINISGIIFHVEEDAYEKLNRYLSTIRSYFAVSEGRDEIMADIEARIAELLKEKVTVAKQVILMADVDQVITIMGKPEDFAEEGAEQSAYELPSMSAPRNKRRRVFRDPDEKILGGVCSGISAYFDMDPMWLRIIWAVLAIGSFGTFFLIYILFWIILPEARTTADKLEMRGEKVNINNIEKSIREELGGIKKKVSDLNNDGRGTRMLQDLGNFIKTVLKSIFTLVGKFIYLILIIVSLAILIAVLAAIFGSANAVHIKTGNIEASYGLQQILFSIFGDMTNVRLALLALFLFVCIPLIMILYKAISRLAGVRRNIPALNYTALGLWITGVILGFYLLTNVATSFKEKGISSQVVDIKQPTGETLYLNVSGPQKWSFDTEHRSEPWSFFRLKDGDTEYGLAELNIEPSLTDSFSLEIRKSARGENKKEAMNFATELSYSFTQNDSVIDFSNYYELKENSQWRAQKVKITVYVPKDKKIYLNRNMKSLIYDIDNIHNVYDMDMVGRTWIMTERGLDCVDCTGLELNNKESIKAKHFNSADHRHEVNIEINGKEHSVTVETDEPGKENNENAGGKY